MSGAAAFLILSFLTGIPAVVLFMLAFNEAKPHAVAPKAFLFVLVVLNVFEWMGVFLASASPVALDGPPVYVHLAAAILSFVTLAMMLHAPQMHV